jgi:hypothetical protein
MRFAMFQVHGDTAVVGEPVGGVLAALSKVDGDLGFVAVELIDETREELGVNLRCIMDHTLCR